MLKIIQLLIFSLLMTGWLSVNAQEKKTYNYANGKPKAEGAMVGEKKVGDWVFYYESGLKMREGTYTNGVPTGTWVEYTENGGKKSEGAYVSSGGEAIKHGNWIYYHPNGALQSEGRYNRGKKVGRWTSYNTLSIVIGHKDY